ncbi:hypothetical protein FHG87_008264 [Trinorchestia longiramus]|nr:hypothetical protein FHG87_008264 [Trinorchestia longiramus]
MTLQHRNLIFLFIFALCSRAGESAPLFSTLFNLVTSSDTGAEEAETGALKSDNRRFIKSIGAHKHMSHDHQASYEEDNFDTYYVHLPPVGYGGEDHKYNPIYDHADGVDVWELPPFWDGEIVIPNFIPDIPIPHIDPYKGKKKNRIVKGWDNRYGIRLAIPYFGDFQYLREMGPGDFIPQLGPGKFDYPGPGQIDDPGHKEYDPYPAEHYHTPEPPPPVLDLTAFQGLKNYPWYSR